MEVDEVNRLIWLSGRERSVAYLVPPEIAARGTVPVDFALDVPREGIARDELLGQYQSAMSTPRPEGKALQGELRSWSGQLAGTSWYGAEYTRTAAVVMRGRTARVSDGRTQHSIVQSCVDAVEPLSRYTAGWCDSLAALRPDGLRPPVSTAVREAQRFGARQVRHVMIDEKTALHSSSDSVRHFLDDPTVRHPRDEQAALDAYLTKIVVLLEKGESGETELTRTDINTLTELADSLANRGAVPAGRLSDEVLGEYRRDAVEFLTRVVESDFADRRRNSEQMAEAFARVVVTYVNRQCAGKPLEGTEHYLKLRLAAVRIDEWRRDGRRRRGERRLVVGDERDSARADDRAEDTTAPPSASDAHDVVAVAIAIIDSDPGLQVNGALCWEATLASEMLAGRLGIDAEASQADLKAAVAQRWMSEKPQSSRSGSAQAAAMDVLLTAQTAVNRAAMRIHAGSDREGGE